MYAPPFKISSRAINLIAEIAAQIERYAIRLEQDDKLRLHKANRIKTIHSSLAIEGNSLSENEVCAIIDGKNIIAPIREIQEVRNAIKAYELYPHLDAFNEKDLLLAHATMMQSLIDAPGNYRTGGVGVFGESGIIHIAPPAERVSALMKDLFHWLRESNDHLLIRSCVFHYEFEFIHPFPDGNGRIGRLWQSLILGRLHPLFEHLPIENMVYRNQQAYYNALSESTNSGESGAFIDFMLSEILDSLKDHQGEKIFSNKKNCEVPNKLPNKLPNKSEQTILQLLKENGHFTRLQLSQITGMSDSGIKYILTSLKSAGFITRTGSNKSGYWIVSQH